MAATGWSWPATVRAAPCSAGGSPAYRSRPAADPPETAGGEQRGGEAGRRDAVRPGLAGGLVDQPGAGRQRGLPDELRAEPVDDPLGHAGPAVGRRQGEALALQPQQLGEAGLAVPRQAGTAGELLGQRGFAGTGLAHLLGAALVEPGDHRCARARPAASSSTPLSARPATPTPSARTGPTRTSAARTTRPSSSTASANSAGAGVSVPPSTDGPRRPGLDECDLPAGEVAHQGLRARRAEVEPDHDLGGARSWPQLP